MKKIILFLTTLLLSATGIAQELNCQVSVTSSQVEGTDKQVFQTMQNAIYEFINSRKWSNNNFRTEERIECTILITISERLSADAFKGSLNLVLRRPVLNTAYNTVLLNYVDKDFAFGYVEYQPLDYNDGTFTSNLTSVLAYYIYVFLGLEFDSFAPNGGTVYLQKAQDVVTAAQNSQETGWKGYESQNNRYWLVENFLNPANSELRNFMYQYHRNGLDMMYEKVDQGRAAITESLNLLKTIYDERPDIMALRLILDAKRDELVNIYSDQRVPPMEKTTVANLLKEIDPANSSKYQTILQGN
ncbi:MAG TPA: DUF4835 family protein [Bacteroidales bacterium]|nr:DUF4835 family protein [Bacteroidales bacterium]